MSRRFTSSELFTLRNEIPIDKLIEKNLFIPIERTGSKLRFACPICSGFDTSINKESNLARCFHCKKNFNTIDMVMRQMGISFVESVRRLKKYHADGIGRSISTESQEKFRNLESFTPIGEIIPKILPQRTNSDVKNTKPSDRNVSVSNRIEELEKKFDKMSVQLENLCTLLQSR